MGDFSFFGGAQGSESGGRSTGSTRGTTVTSSTTAHTKGSWAQILAATSFDAVGLWVHTHAYITAGSSQKNNFLVDLGVGGAGSEVVRLPDLFLEHGASGMTPMGSTKSVFFPLAIPSGTRIAARCQADTDGSGGSNALDVSVTLLRAGWYTNSPAGFIETAGVDSSNSRGTSVSPNASANTKGSWAQLTAATTRAWTGFYLAVGTESINTGSYLLDIAIDHGATPRIILPDLPIGIVQESAGDAISHVDPGWFYIPAHVPAGAQLGVRCQYRSASGNPLYVAAYGIVL